MQILPEFTGGIAAMKPELKDTTMEVNKTPSDNRQRNPLAQDSIGSLLWKFSVPSIIAMLVSSLYNIVDQFFIGRSVGELGNAATNISFPLSISCIAIALLFGIGGASAFNISTGQGEQDPEEKQQAVFYLGNAATLLSFTLPDHPAVFRAYASVFRFAGQCAGLCENLHPYRILRISLSDPYGGRRSSDPGRRTAQIRHDL